MAKRTVKILGKISDTNKQPIAKLRIEAWDKDMLIDDFVGEAISDEQGAFVINFEEKRYKELFLDRDPDIYFKIYDGDAFIQSTENAVLWNIKAEEVIVEIVIDRENENPLGINDKSFKVEGYVHKSDGSAFVGGLVYAYDKDLRTEALLGKAITNEAGYYEITYSPDKLGKANKGNADLQVRLIEIVNDKEEKILAASEIFFNAPPVQEINLTQTASPAAKEKSEWEKMNEQVLPLLKGQGKIEEKKVIKYEDLSPSELSDKDVDFIVSETNLDRLAVNAWAASNKIFNEAVQRLNAEHAEEQAIINEYGWAFFYGLARLGLANNIDAVLQQPAENLKRGVSAAVFANRIPEMNNKNIEQLVKAIELIQRLQLIDLKQTIDSPFARILSSVTVPVSRKLALDALTIVQQKGMENPDAVLELVKQYPGEEKAVNSLVRSLRVNQLVNSHVALFQNLNARLDGEAHSIAPLATIPISEWVDIAAKTSVSHAAVMEVQVNLEIHHPLTALGAKLYDGSIQMTDEISNKIKTFIKHDEVKAEAILKGQTKVKDDAGAPDPETFVKNLGRFVRTGLNMELAGFLMNIGLDTPALVIRYGGDFIKDQIREKLPFLESDETIDRFIGTADKYVKGGLELIAGGYSMNAVPVGYYGVDEPIPPGIRENLPSLPGFFGDMDECMCKPCESMLGQPAYLVDLLTLLKKVTSNNPSAPTGLDLLNLRRSDIAELKLSCENAEAEIQHIDITLGILEKAAGENAYQQQMPDTIYPWQFPFELSRAEIKANLTKLNISRIDLRFLKSTDPSKDKLLAAEILDLSFTQTNIPNFISEWQLLTERRGGEKLWSAYGFYPVGNDDHISLIDPASSEKLIDLPIKDVLVRISVLLDRTGLDLNEFEEMIATAFIGQLSIVKRNQCKTSIMRLNIAPQQIEDCLDRIHRFVRLHHKVSDWSFKELDLAISACQFSDTSAITTGNREELLIKLATIKRLSDQYTLPINLLIKVPDSIPGLCQILGLTPQQLSLLTAITGLNLNSFPFSWEAFEKFCTAVKRITEIGLNIEQVAETLLTRAQLKNFSCPLNEAYKSDEAITDFLEKLREHISSVVVADLNIDLKTQVSDQLTAIFDAANAAVIVNAISDAGAEMPIVLTSAIKEQIKNTLLNKPATKNVLGYSFPLLPYSLVEELVAVKTSGNPSAEFRFSQFILSRLREKALITKISELCTLSETEISDLLKGKLLLDDTASQQNTVAYNLFLDQSFLIEQTAQHEESFKRLFAWLDRLFRLKSLKAKLSLENELLQLTEHIVVDNVKGTNWRDALAVIDGTTGNRWPNKNWQAIEDVVWLQQPDKLSRKPLLELFTNLEKYGNAAFTRDVFVFQPWALRLNVPPQQILDFAEHLISNGTGNNWLDAAQLRKLFMHLMFARKLNVGLAPINELADIQDNASVKVVTENLLTTKFKEKELEEVKQSINDLLRPQKRNALVGLLIQKKQPYIKNANDLYEHYLIDPLMEPCMKTTRILEAITATQLFAQRILFGLEPGIKDCSTLKQQWTWMRNYRVWEANRKVFLFPENWLYPELRDDKSSSFKQLESALGQGELNPDLADEVFGQFLDDVAQMGQVEVLGMFEDLKDSNTRRDLYVVGRSPNPPYIYYWRKCIDFGTRFMEWSPWQRIELDIQGDHVLPFVLDGQLHIAWPLIRFIKEDKKPDTWEVKLAWSRYDGRTWRKANISREVIKIPDIAFLEERWGFSFRCKTINDDQAAEIGIYTLDQISNTDKKKPDSDSAPNPLSSFIFPPNFSAPTPNYFVEVGNLIKNDCANNLIDSNLNKFDSTRLSKFVKDNYPNLPDTIKDYLEVYVMAYGKWCVPSFDKVMDISGGDPLYDQIKRDLDVATIGHSGLFTHPEVAIARHQKARDHDNTNLKGALFDKSANDMLDDYLIELAKSTAESYNYSIFNNLLQAACSRLTLSCEVWLRVKVLNNTAEDLKLIVAGTYSCSINGNNLTPNSPIESTKLGKHESLSCKMKLAVGQKTLPDSEPENTAEVPAGKYVNQTLRFEIDGRTLTEAELYSLGIVLSDTRVLSLKSKFNLGRYDDIIISPPTQQLPLSQGQVAYSQAWMNGYAENISLGNPPASNPIKISGTQVLETSPRGQFWAVGAATSFDTNSTNVWHFSDSGLRGYVDLDTGISDSKSEFSVYANSYNDATQYRVNWSQERFLNQPYLPDGAFLTKELIRFGVENNTKLWIQTHDKELASQQELHYESDLRFNNQLPYACYNWEVFFHAPLMVADQLSKQHKFEDAERWLRYIFDPTSGEPGTDAKRFLKFRVFREMDLNNQGINDLKALAQAASGLATGADIDKVKKLINRWREMPFRPFVIARGRQIAFLWRTLFAYIDNLIVWADSLYRQDTRESINEAVMIYVLAQKILGRRPQVHEGKSKKDAVSYNQLAGKWDDFANYWIDIGGRGSDRIYRGGKIDTVKHPSSEGMLYFCMPFNDKMLNYWNNVDDRLFNIRHCRNIEGIDRTLPLMDTPIDPELLIRAVNDGFNLGDVINGLYAPPPQYRYSLLAARAADLCNETRALGAAMLSAIEKKDAEYLSLLRFTNEISLLKLVSEVKTLQITEAERNIDALGASRKSVGTRYYQYQRLLGKKDIKIPAENESVGEESMLGRTDGVASELSSLGLIDSENKQIEYLDIAQGWAVAGGITKGVAGATHMSASIVRATSAGAASVASEVLTSVGTALSTTGDMFDLVSRGWQHGANKHNILGGHLRRRDEWAFQSNQTLKELQQIDKQILANKIRIDIARKELSNHIEKMEQAQAVDEVMRSKFSNEQLYQWMVTQLSGLYFNAYRMTLEMARSAERAASRELGVKPLHILRNDYWDSLHMGLLAGDRLHQDLKRLEITYLDQNRREYEMTKHISLRRLNPEALVNLRITDLQNGKCECEFDIPEWLFDLDTPGHYLRRIKSVSLSIPCIVGPYTTVNCKLTLLNSHIRHDRSDRGGYERQAGEDPRFTDCFGASEAVVTSNANGDSGLFDTQLRDERFLPFEGSGVISRWRLELPGKFKQFDYSTISDVILSIRYTAREGGDSLKTAATTSVSNFINNAATGINDREGLFTLIDLKHDMPNEWNQLVKNLTPKIKIDKDRFPYMAQGKVKIDTITFFAKAKRLLSNDPIITVTPSGLSANAAYSDFDCSLIRYENSSYYKRTKTNFDGSSPSINGNIPFQFDLHANAADVSEFDDLIMVIKYVLPQ